MKRFTDAGRACIAAENFYAGLSLALTIPDICGSLVQPGPGRSKARYEAWCKTWLEPKFTANVGRTQHTFVTAEDCYQLRCSLVHSGQSEIDPSKVVDVSRFEFFDNSTGNHLGRIGASSVNGVRFPAFLQLKATDFSLTMFDAADEWDLAVAGDAAIQAEKQKLLIIHSAGVTLGGVRFD